MTFLYGFITGWWSASLMFCIALALYLLRRPRYTAPTLRRRNRDREQIREQVRGGEQIAEPIYMYGVTGLEDQ